MYNFHSYKLLSKMRYYQAATVFTKFTFCPSCTRGENYRIRPIKTYQVNLLPVTYLDHDQMAQLPWCSISFNRILFLNQYVIALIKGNFKCIGHCCKKHTGQGHTEQCVHMDGPLCLYIILNGWIKNGV